MSLLRSPLRAALRAPLHEPLVGPWGGTVEIVGGLAVGSEGEEGSFYEGYTLSWGDDFNSLNIVGPGTPRARWFPTRAYLPGARGSDTLLGSLYDTDPFHTGHNDSNRGVAVGFDNMSVANSAITLQARPSTSGERAHFSPTDAAINGGVRSELAAIIHGSGAFVYYPSTDAAIILEWRAKYSAAASNPTSWHPDLWSFSLGTSNDNNEWDFEGDGTATYYDQNLWTDGSYVGTFYGGNTPHDNVFHTFAFVLRNGGDTEWWVDGVKVASVTADSNSHGRPAAPIMTSHVLQDNWKAGSYSKAAWDGDANGASLTIDWIRGWRQTGLPHYGPGATISDLNVAFTGTGSIVLPSKAALWGDGTVEEDLRVIPFEENEPAGSHTVALAEGQFPTGVSYDSGTRTISVNFALDSAGKAGRLHLSLAAYQTTGSTCEPARIIINRGPNVLASSITATAGVASEYDLYANCDVGRITPKTIVVSGLPSGATFSSSTGLITFADTTVEGTTQITVTLTNSVGQQVIATPNVVIGAAAVTSFSCDFTGGGTTNLDQIAGFTLAGGNANGIQQTGGVAKANDSSSNGTMYLTPQLTFGATHYIEATLDNQANGGICVRATDRNNCFVLRRAAADHPNIAKIVGGTATVVAAFSTTITSANVMRFYIDEDTQILHVFKDGVEITALSSGSLTVGTGAGWPTASEREGILARTAITTAWLDDLATGLV